MYEEREVVNKVEQAFIKTGQIVLSPSTSLLTTLLRTVERGAGGLASEAELKLLGFFPMLGETGRVRQGKLDRLSRRGTGAVLLPDDADDATLDFEHTMRRWGVPFAIHADSVSGERYIVYNVEDTEAVSTGLRQALTNSFRGQGLNADEIEDLLGRLGDPNRPVNVDDARAVARCDGIEFDQVPVEAYERDAASYPGIEADDFGPIDYVPADYLPSEAYGNTKASDGDGQARLPLIASVPDEDGNAIVTTVTDHGFVVTSDVHGELVEMSLADLGGDSTESVAVDAAESKEVRTAMTAAKGVAARDERGDVILGAAAATANACKSSSIRQARSARKGTPQQNLEMANKILSGEGEGHGEKRVRRDGGETERKGIRR